MRDLVAREALRTMARDAAERFRELVEAGHEIPYEVEEPGNGSPLPRYIPLTARFVRDHAPALQKLDSFGTACAAIESAELAGPFLDELGIEVPPDARRRSELAGTVFLCRLWMDSTDFSLDGDRLNEAIAELESGGEAAGDEIEVVVPLRGLQLPVARLDLATASIVRADTVDVPPETRVSEGGGAAGWEPTFLAATRVGASKGTGQDEDAKPDVGARAVEAFRQLITALRLFQAGGVGLGPYAWTRAGGDRWRRIATGAGRPRPGGYRLAAEVLEDLTNLSRTLAYRSSAFGKRAGDGSGPGGALHRAISRFEAGLERSLVLEALNDYLLALRFVLEGGGPADLGLSMRVAALCAEPELRSETKSMVDQALALERQLWSGDPAPSTHDGPTAAETAVAVEDLTRAILRDAGCGHLGGDLRSTADEILLADGLAVGEGRAEQRGGDEEWDLPTEQYEIEDDDEEVAEPQPGLREEVDERSVDAVTVASGAETVGALPAVPSDQLWLEVSDDWHRDDERRERHADLQVPEPGGRIRIESHPKPEEDNVFTRSHTSDNERGTEVLDAPESTEDRVDQALEERPRERQHAADRVAYLFPRPETTEWSVRELSYDRRRRAEPQPELRAS